MTAKFLLNDGRISSEDVIYALVNLKQLVFEVTDACNLKCKYCAYGDLYFGYDKRSDSFLSINKGKAIIDYLCSIWNSNISCANYPKTYVSFYGGEPLMNIDFIKAIVAYIARKEINREIIFSITTNGVLLDKYIEYLIANKFNILVSLDGNSYANQHRIRHDGHSSFNKVYTNIKMIQTKYPDYFLKHVNFNSVLHNLNSVETSYEFFFEEFGKTTNIAELNTSNIKDDKVNEFLSLYKNKSESIQNSLKYEELADKIKIGNPQTQDLLIFLHQYSGNVYKNYSDLFVNHERLHFCPTGTCVPFGKKLFITVNGKILQCEKIPQKYSLGIVNEKNEVKIDIEYIVNSFNAYLGKIQPQCSHCFNKKSCVQCLYYIHDIDKDNPKCQGMMTKSSFEQYVHSCISYLYRHPELYGELLKDIIIE